jgi:hypothetical protein
MLPAALIRALGPGDIGGDMAERQRRSMFVAMPFKPEYDPVLQTIKSAADLLNLDVIDVGEQSFTGSIMSQVRNAIEESVVVTAIVSEENGNVYYEIGLAHCQKKAVVLLTSDPKKLKFDLHDHRAIVYDAQNPSLIRDELVRTIQSALEAEHDAGTFLVAAMGTTRLTHPSDALDEAIHSAIERITSLADLEEPVKLFHLEKVPKNGELAIEVQDFVGTRIRAFIDINGLIRKWVRVQT